MTTTLAGNTTADPASRVDGGTVLLIDKPQGWTSFDVVARIRGGLNVRKVGHAGTLDPLATGLLIVCTGQKTKEISQYSSLDKEYEGEMVLGSRTKSFDAETPVYEQRSTDGIDATAIRSACAQFQGAQKQTPPMWSAVKRKGKPLYKYARKGLTVDRPTRDVTIHALEVVAVELPRVMFRVVCSKGTYVRALVEDIGLRLGCGAYLASLRRTRIGPFTAAEALSIEQALQRRDQGASGTP
jgi:tRNA pseudouridine55 synthase